MYPSTIVEFMKATYSWLPDQTPSNEPRNPGEIRALLTMLDRLPDERLNPTDLTSFILSIEQLKSGLAVDGGKWRPFQSTEARSVRTIYHLLDSCPDDAPAVGTSEPAFISDLDLRADLHRDLAEVNRSLHNREWKGATVPAGSILEALLLWALQHKRTAAELHAVADALRKKIDLTRRPLDRWDLFELIEYAHATELISDATNAAANLCREYRNLIHPGKTIRLKTKCNRATALLATGAVEAVINDLS
jgi:hypothetical protein